MKLKTTVMILGFAALAIFLVAGFVGILERRFDQGELYPHYASYRSDPLGTSALYESLADIPALAVERNLTHLNGIGGLDGDTVLLLLGFPRDELDELRAPENSPVMAAVEKGARLVIAVNPQQVPASFRRDRDREEQDWFERRRRLQEEHNRRRVERQSKEGEEGEDSEELEERLKEETKRLEEETDAALGRKFTGVAGFEMEAPSFTRPEGGWEVNAGPDLAEGIFDELPDWFSQYRLTTDDGVGWREILEVEGRPVVIERDYGEGTIVVASDSYFLSNESLHLGAQPGFLVWLLGGKTRVIFDETTHGTVETGGAMKLMRRYRVHGIFFGLIVFFILWAWRGAVPLVPGSEDADRALVDGGTVIGEDSGSGLVRLLRRSIPASELIARCVEVWRGSVATRATPALEEKIAALVARQQTEGKTFTPADAYRAIAGLVRKR